MRIKQVSIQGFKSFMDRLDITFPAGISGVVGPNGCGKSNVVDAIRWCMGEQSPRQLRGRKMEDVIFNGAETSKPMGMAEVSLIFENGAGDFPPAFAHAEELAVTRRLYRSGESEYLLNSMSCRLKDIQELFMDTGLGNKAYSIISQGRIGSIVEQRPEETRAMIEEAAGITRYRRQVGVTQKKIEQTQGNLQRLDDILNEIEKQIRSLKRQAGKAERFKALTQKIQHAELIFFANLYGQLTAKSHEKARVAEKLRTQKETMTAALSALEAKMAHMNFDLESQESALADFRKAHREKKDQTAEKERAIKSLDSEIKTQTELADRLDREQKEVQTRISELEEKQDHLKTEIERLEKQTAHLQEEVLLKDERHRVRKRLILELREEFETARKRLNAGENHTTGLNHESEFLNKTLKRISDRKSSLEMELTDTRGRYEKVLKASEKRSRVREALNEKLDQIETTLAETVSEQKELERIKGRARGDVQAAEKALNLNRSRLASLEGLMENFEGCRLGVRTIMKARDFSPGKEGNLLGVLADLIQVDPRFEGAIEAILGERLQYIITRNPENAEAGIGYLKEKAKGIASFVPLENFSKSRPQNEPPKDLTPLLKYVTTSGELAPFLSDLMHHVMVAPDLSTAILEQRKNGGQFSFVTLEGDVVDQRGVMTGGWLSRASGGLLARKREITDLREAVNTAQNQLDDLNFQMEDILGDMEERSEQVNALTEEKWACRDEMGEADKQLFRLAQELDQLDKTTRKISGELAENQTEQEKQTHKLEKLHNDIAESREAHQKHHDRFQEKEAQLKDAEAEFEALREKMSGLKTEVRLSEEAKRGTSREMDMVRQYLQDSRNRVHTIKTDLEKGEIHRDECGREKITLTSELVTDYHDLEQAMAQMKAADREYRKLREALGEIKRQSDDLKRDMTFLSEKITENQMNEGEIRLRLETLLERFRETSEYHLPTVYREYLEKDFDEQTAKEAISKLKEQKSGMGEVNLTAIAEHAALKERREFMRTQREDLLSAMESLRAAMRKINRKSLEKFTKTFQEVDQKLKEIFPILFDGGTAGLKLTNEEKPLESGVLVEVKPPGKRLSHMGLLSGGEKALVAMALIFAIYMIRPSPFCLLDEVDAPLDEANIDRFNNLLKEIKRQSQIIMVTHSRKTMEVTDRLLGITMEERGLSKLVSVDLQNLQDQISAN